MTSTVINMEPIADKPAHGGAGGRPAFIFIRPQLGANMGAAARGMRNFGLDRMILVSPPSNWLGPEAVARASGAAELLENALLFDSVTEAVSHFHYIYATTVRQRGMWKPVLGPRQAMQDTSRRIRDGQQVAILFGPERTGLENEELVAANAIVTVPTMPDFRSLNIAHCAVLMAYEWSRHCRGSQVDHAPSDNQAAIAASATRNAMADLFIDDLVTCGYFENQEDTESKRMFLKNFLCRLELTEAEVKTMHRIRKTLRTGPFSTEAPPT